MPATISPDKIAKIEFQGGRCHFVDDPRAVYAESQRLAAETGGHYLDQFTYAERATDWRGNNNIAESIFGQMRQERASRARLGGVRRRHRRDLGHDRPLHPLPPPGRRGCAWSTRSARCSTATSPTGR